MDEEYVQEHILTGGICQLEAPRRHIHGRLQPFRSVLSRHTRHICGVLRAPRMRGPRCGRLRVKLVAPTSQAAALFYRRPFEIAPAIKPLLRGDMTEQGCKLMATLGAVVNSLGNLEAALPAASALAKRHVDYGVKAADYTPVGAARLWTLEQNLGLR
jgi:Globin